MFFAIVHISIHRKINRTAPGDAVLKRNDIIYQPKDVVDSRSNAITIIQPNKPKDTKNDEASPTGCRSQRKVHIVQGQQNGK